MRYNIAVPLKARGAPGRSACGGKTATDKTAAFSVFLPAQGQGRAGRKITPLAVNQSRGLTVFCLEVLKMAIKVKRICYFVELGNGTTRNISEKEYNKKIEYYTRRSWDRDDFSRNFINTAEFVQYENCITFYDRDAYFTLGYIQREIY